MIIYNITVNVEAQTAEAWKTWMKQVHIPAMLATGCFKGYKFLRLLTEVEDNPGLTFAVQMECEHMADLDTYMDKHAEKLRADHKQEFEGRYVAFRSILEEV